jgi:uncharacterized protein YceK
MRSRTIALFTVPFAVLLVTSGCGSDVANEQAVENAIENANPSVDVDAQDGGAGITATDEDGNEVGVGTAAQVPSDFPSAVPLPEGTLTVAAKSPDGAFTLQYQVSQEPGDAAVAYRTQLEGANFTVDDTAAVAGSSGFSATGNGYEVDVLAIGVGGTTGLSISVQPE